MSLSELVVEGAIGTSPSRLRHPGQGLSGSRRGRSSGSGPGAAPDAAEPGLLLSRERASGANLLKGPLHALLGRQQRFPLAGGVLDHRDDVHQRLLVAGLVGLLQVLDGESLRRGRQPVLQLHQGSGLPVLRAVEKDADGVDFGRVVADEAGEGFQVIFGLVFLAGGVADKVFGRKRCPGSRWP